MFCAGANPRESLCVISEKRCVSKRHIISLDILSIINFIYSSELNNDAKLRKDNLRENDRWNLS